jgi:4a-hydroxytetrahydrobiopterin dehydratase
MPPAIARTREAHRRGGSAVVALRSCAQTRPASATPYEKPLTRTKSRGDRQMETLTRMKCVACRKEAPTVTDAELAEFYRQVSDWDIVELDGIKRLRRAFSVDDFAQALEFTKKVGELAEEEGHHPALLTEWGGTTVTWWTHKIKGLHRNDFIWRRKRTSYISDEPIDTQGHGSRRPGDGEVMVARSSSPVGRRRLVVVVEEGDTGATLQEARARGGWVPGSVSRRPLAVGCVCIRTRRASRARPRRGGRGGRCRGRSVSSSCDRSGPRTPLLGWPL